jgi:cytochrome c oxidase assembly factor CtaG
LAVALLLAELVAAAYLTLMAYLLSAWFVDDSQAATMTDRDWLVSGLISFVTFVVVALVFAGVVYLAGRLTLKPEQQRWPLLRWLPSVLLALPIVVASAAGAYEFITTKPFM